MIPGAGQGASRRAAPSPRRRPSVIVPTHHDAFFGSLDLGERLLPGIDLDGFYDTARLVDPKARIATPLYRDELVIPKDGDARDLCVA